MQELKEKELEQTEQPVQDEIVPEAVETPVQPETEPEVQPEPETQPEPEVQPEPELQPEPEEQPEETDDMEDWEPEEVPPEQALRRNHFWMGFLVGAMLVLIAVPVTALAMLLNQQPPVTEVRTETVVQTRYVTKEPTAPSWPPLEPNPLYPKDFVYENGYMVCTARPSVMGIDVSTHQKKIDWEQVKAAGVEFAMLRAAYRGYGNGAVLEDELVRTHYAGARAAGIKVGFYFFSQAVNTREAVEEAEFLLNIIGDWQVDMPIVFDWEYISDTARTAGLSPRILTDCAVAFCERIREAGYEPMVYFNAIQSRREMYMQELTPYKFWLAMYSDSMTYEHKVDMWQYTQSGRIPGIEGDVDINLYFPEN